MYLDLNDVQVASEGNLVMLGFIAALQYATAATFLIIGVAAYWYGAATSPYRPYGYPGYYPSPYAPYPYPY